MAPLLSPAVASRDTVFLARQPILDRSGAVRAYELLYRRGENDEQSRISTPDAATASVLHAAALNLGFETLAPGRPAFVNVTQTLLLAGIDLLVRPESVVLEVLETVDVTDEVIAACRALHAKGYAIALDDFVPGSSAERLFPYARYLKVDVLALEAAARRELLQRVPRHLHLLAEKVETAEMFAATRDEGFELFQGYHFCRPAMLQTTDMSVQQVSSLRMLEALNRPGVTLVEVEGLIKHDPSLCHRVLRYVNSAALGLSAQVRSIREAIMLIGLDPIRKWVSVWALTGLNRAQTPEVMTMAVVRARCCERFGASVLGADAGGELFLLGLCSLLDVLLRQPMESVLQAVLLPQRTNQALRGERGVERELLDAVIAMERGDWDAATAGCRRLGARASDLSTAFADALRWADGLDH